MQTQKERILEVLRAKRGEWVSGEYFLRTLYLSQFHARIFELQRAGYGIVASDTKNEHGFVAYKLVSEPMRTVKVKVGNQEYRQGVLI